MQNETYEEYLKLSQWQRFLDILQYKGFCKRRFAWSGIWFSYIDNPGYKWNDIKHWKWGFDVTQNDERLYLGPVVLLLMFY